MSPSTRRIGVIRGDGIGPEIVEAALAVVRAALGREWSEIVTFVDVEAGAAHYKATGRSIEPRDLEHMSTGELATVLKGPVGLPDVRAADGTEAGLLGGILRSGLDAYANIRPIRLLPGVASALHDPGDIDYVIVRENTEGLYASRGSGAVTHWAASDALLMTRPGVERIAHKAFRVAAGREGAPLDGVRRVTCVDKSNVLRSYAFFRAIVREVAASYPDIELDYLYVDAAAAALVAEPGRFDVLVTENFLGDILSDLGAATVGGLGMCPSGNIGVERAYFEPIHGSAPTIAGQDLATRWDRCSRRRCSSSTSASGRRRGVCGRPSKPRSGTAISSSVPARRWAARWPRRRPSSAASRLPQPTEARRAFSRAMTFQPGSTRRMGT
jgi:isocitrate/isopropylmalate dehydrogenase